MFPRYTGQHSRIVLVYNAHKVAVPMFEDPTAFPAYSFIVTSEESADDDRTGRRVVSAAIAVPVPDQFSPGDRVEIAGFSGYVAKVLDERTGPWSDRFCPGGVIECSGVQG